MHTIKTERIIKKKQNKNRQDDCSRATHRLLKRQRRRGEKSRRSADTRQRFNFKSAIDVEGRGVGRRRRGGR